MRRVKIDDIPEIGGGGIENDKGGGGNDMSGDAVAKGFEAI
jgi:hypothetical protein